MFLNSNMLVKVINNQDGIEIEIPSLYPNIFLDDSIKKIKDKLFLYNPEFIPNFLKVEVEVGSTKILVDNSNNILYEYFDAEAIKMKENSIIYITNLQNIINIEPENLIQNSELFEVVLNDLKKEYIDLKHEDLLFLIKLQILNKQYSTIQVDYSEINGYITSLQNKRNLMLKKINERSVIIEEFNKISNTEFDFNEMIISYNDISLNILPDNFETGTKGVFIKLDEIYNILELNDTIPFIALGKKNGTLPQIKIFNNLKVNYKEIKSWVLNEKKKLNEASYKIIKGLMIKALFGTSNYLTINLLPNGLLYVNLKLTQDEQNKYSDLDNLIFDIKIKVDEIIEYLNTFNGVFLKSKRISIIEKSKVTIESIDTSIETSIYIDKLKFESIIKNQYISENILELKRTESLDILSIYYKKYKMRNESDDIKGLTINIRDNQYKKNSSIIKIFGTNTYNQTLIILLNILIVNEMGLLLKNNGLFDEVKKRKIREKTNKKILKEQGINFDSRECQAIRQPNLLEHGLNQQPKTDQNSIIHNNKYYKCNNEDYPYPGFTKNNIVCCFKYNQSGNESYIKNINPDSLTTLVEPSNYKITIGNYETYVIKVDNIDNEPKYYYLSQDKNELVAIYKKSLIKEFDDLDNIWLEKVPLAQIIYQSATNKCSHKPNFKGFPNSGTTLHQQCSEYEKYFGYTSKSIPCCFDKEKDAFITRKKKESDITKQYIIQSSDKPLNYQKMGILNDDLSELFNNLLVESNDKFYRMGVIQNNNSFLNAILLGISSSKITSLKDLKNIMIKYVENKVEFDKLNNGNISIKYSIQEYINYINGNKLLHWVDFIDLLERLLEINILIFSNEPSRLLCRPIPLNPKNFNKPFLILLERKNTFELIIQLILHSDKKNDVVKSFNYDNKIIKFITEYYKDSCIKENLYPQNYPYIPINPYQSIIQSLSENTLLGDIKYQVINNFNKINFLITKRGFIIPILETGIIDNYNIKVISFSSLIKQKTKLLSLENYIKAFPAFNFLTNKTAKIIGIVDSNIQDIGGIMTNFGSFIPYLKTQFDSLFIKLDFKYYLDVDEKIQSVSSSIQGKFEQYSLKDNNIKTSIFNLKTIIGNEIQQYSYIKDDIENIIKSNILKEEKINNILNIFLQFPIPKTSETLTLLKSIANEILNDNIENLILNNIITNDKFNKNDVKIRESESILLNINDIRQWIKNYSSLES